MFNPEKTNHFPLKNEAETREKSEKLKNATSAIDNFAEKMFIKINEKV